MEQELNTLRARVAELESKLQEQKLHQQQHASPKDWIRNNLEEAQQIIDSIVGIKGITEDPLKAAAQLEGLAKMTPYTNTELPYDWNVNPANTAGTLERNFSEPSHEELYGY